MEKSIENTKLLNLISFLLSSEINLIICMTFGNRNLIEFITNSLRQRSLVKCIHFFHNSFIDKQDNTKKYKNMRKNYNKIL